MAFCGALPVQELAREWGFTVITVIHDLNLALRFCDKFYFLKTGEGYSYGGIDTVTAETLAAVYGIRAEVLDVKGRKTVIID